MKKKDTAKKPAPIKITIPGEHIEETEKQGAIDAKEFYMHVCVSPMNDTDKIARLENARDAAGKNMSSYDLKRINKPNGHDYLQALYWRQYFHILAGLIAGIKNKPERGKEITAAGCALAFEIMNRHNHIEAGSMEKVRKELSVKYGPSQLNIKTTYSTYKFGSNFSDNKEINLNRLAQAKVIIIDRGNCPGCLAIIDKLAANPKLS